MSGEALLLLPAASALLYVLAALLIKKAIARGAGQTAVNVTANAAAAILFQPLWMLAGPVDWSLAWMPTIAAFTFTIGQIFTFLALRHGDVSVATPLLGLKVLFTAVFAAVIFREVLPVRWWFGAAASSLGVMMVTGATLRELAPRLLRADALSALGAAAFFAVTDVMVQRWLPRLGVGAFVPLMFGAVGVMSVLYGLPQDGLRIFHVPRSAMPVLVAGSMLLGVQILGMALALGLYGNATVVNIVYSSRSVWSVVLAWMLARWSGPHESAASSQTMGRRLAGSVLLFAAVAAVLL